MFLSPVPARLTASSFSCVCLVLAIVETLHLKNICHQTWTGTKGVIKTSSWDRYSSLQDSLSLLIIAPFEGDQEIPFVLCQVLADLISAEDNPGCPRPGPSFTVFGVTRGHIFPITYNSRDFVKSFNPLETIFTPRG